MATAFSRLQLAKALIEYDNDPSNPNVPQRNAEQSAIFAHLRRTLPSRQMTQTVSAARRSTDYLGVALPNDGGSSDSVSQHRKSQASIDALRNPFGRDSTHEGHVDDDEIEVDLSSWGLDAFGPSDKGSKKKLKAKEEALPNPHPLVQDSARRRPAVPSSRTMSMGNLEQFGEGGAFLDSASVLPNIGARRYSVGSPLDYPDVEPTDPSLRHTRRASGHVLIDSIPTTPPLHAVQFPTSEPPVPVSPLAEEGPSELRPTSRASLLDPAHGRSYSSASMRGPAPEDETNPFAIRPPSPDRASRFDPKYMRARTVSNGTLGTQMLLNDVDAEPGREREVPDTASLATDRGPSRLYSRLELMRPKVLIMPSPLQGTESQMPVTTPRDGFQFNTIDGPPLPPAAISGPRSSVAMSVMERTPSLSPSTSYFNMTPNPRASMTLSQLTFRNNLMVDGQRDVAYVDIDEQLRRATEDGQQADLTALEQQPTGSPNEVPAADEAFTPGRPPGKLYGKSLIDQLQARKVEMKGKQRVFTGDQRPSMMHRTAMKRSSTLIDPESLKQRPVTSRFDTDVQALSRGNSLSHRKTLINFDDEVPGAPKGLLGADHALGGAGRQTKSVFGVDTIWERELAKLREIEAMEKQEEEEKHKRDAEGSDKKRKGKGRRKGKDREREQTNTSASPNLGLSPVTTPGPDATSTLSPVGSSTSPVNKRGALKRPPPPPIEGEEEESEEESDSSSTPAHPQPGNNGEERGWHSDSDEERGPRRSAPESKDLHLSLRFIDEENRRRTTGMGPRYPNLPPRLLALQSQGQLQLDDDEDSEEDLPLVATIGRAAQRATRISADDDSSDEDVPLTALLDKTKMKLPTVSVGGSLFDRSGRAPSAAGSQPRGRVDDDEDEDEKPLGLRVSRVMSAPEDEDDKPLGLHPEQMRRSQFFVAAQAAQQQQMMMQAQAQAALHQSMMFGAPSIMSGPFYGAPMAPPMMIPPQIPSTPPPVPDTVKLNRVDKWRHDVAVEEEV